MSRAARARSPVGRRGFSLVELLVTMSVIVVLLALFGGALTGARDNARGGTSTNAVSRLDRIIMTQYRRYQAQSVPKGVLDAARLALGTSGTNPSAARAWHIRRTMITADMPDRWSDVRYMATTGTTEGFPRTAAQRAYVATYKAAVNANKTPTDQYGGAECLFMIIMQGGFASCLDCNNLSQLKKGDKDNDGAVEFWDDWNNPIDYILWAPGFQESSGSAKFFTQLDDPFAASGSVRAGLGMRPLVYSAGPNGEYGLNRDSDSANLTRGSSPVGKDCGNHTVGDDTAKTGQKYMGGPDGDNSKRTDNLVNVELKGGS